MKELTLEQTKEVSGGFPPAVVILAVQAGRHYGTKAFGAAITGFIGGTFGGWLRSSN